MTASLEARRLIGAVVMAAHGSDEGARRDAVLAFAEYAMALGAPDHVVCDQRDALLAVARDYWNRRAAIQSALTFFAALEARKAAA